MKERYKCSYAVVTGAAGGIGSCIAKRLLLHGIRVIGIDQNSEALARIERESSGQFLGFEFDLAQDGSEFKPQFEKFLYSHGVDASQIGVFFSNAGFGEFSPFHLSSLEHKQKMLQVNLAQHVALSDYFVKLFRSRAPCRSGIVFTSSMMANMVGTLTPLYHVCKSGVSALGSAIYSENRRFFDCLVVHPSSIKNTGFMQTKEMLPMQKSIVKNVDKWCVAVSPERIVDQMFSRVGKINHCYAGWAAALASLAALFGRNVNCFLWSLTGGYVSKMFK